MTMHQHLFTPFTIGNLTLKNRIVGTAHGTAMITDGVPMEGDLKYWEDRARGGAGLLITGGTIAHPNSGLRRRMLNEAFLEEAVPMFRRRAEVIHDYGAKVIGQLVHLGREMIGGESNYPLSAPSSIQSPRALYRPIELSHEDINEIINSFVLSASNLKKAGYDGVEIHAAHGYLVAQFLSPLTNKRDDEYGGSQKGRMRFLLQLLQAIRNRTGNDFALGVRLSADEEVSGGMKLADTLQIVKNLSENKAIDYLNITVGIRGSYVKDLTTPQGITVAAAKEIRLATNIPIIVSQRIKDPNMAEQILAEGSADLVGIARALIADPEWPNKAATGRNNEIIPCIGCNQDCRSFDPYLFCTVNPLTGRENELERIIPKSANPISIAVVGGGPAGLEAARVAALRGHSVELFEKEVTLGGQVRIAAREPNRSELLEIIHYLELEVRRLGVTVNLGHAVSNTDLKGFDKVILATGAIQEPPKVFGSIKEKVLTVYEVLESDDLSKGVGKTAVVVDDGTGYWPPLSTAGRLASIGYKVIYITSSRTIGASIPHESIQPLLNRLGKSGVQFMILQQLVKANQHNIDVRNILSGEVTNLEMDLLVIDAGRRQDNTLAKQLKEADIPTYLVGDAISPRRISHAILEGHKIARKI